MNKKNKPIWGTRIKGKTSGTFEKVTSSIHVDKRLFKEDIQGSVAHVEMLFKQKIISFKINVWSKFINSFRKVIQKILS